MSMDEYISSVVKTYFFQFREFCRIRSFTFKSAAITPVHVPLYIQALFIIIAFFYSLPKYSINRLQKKQKSVALIVIRTSRSSHINPIPKSFH